ncbi:MAG: 3-oxoacyl-[acyl-carrier protein] reductase, partial [Verrucomicrobiales bacterium]
MVSIDLSGKTALITGGGQGLGRATATTLHAAGAKVVINYFEDAEGLNRGRAEETAAALGERASIAPADVRNLAQVEAMIAEIGQLDILINNAAIIRDRSLKKMAAEEWQAVIDTNLTGVFNLCKAANSALNAGGRIVSMASISGAVGFFGQANYSAAKAGVVGLTKALSKELAKRRITVNAVAPGVVLTEMGESIPEAARQKMLEVIPM